MTAGGGDAASLTVWSRNPAPVQLSDPLELRPRVRLRRCEGFLAETPTTRIEVSGIRYGETSNEPETLEARAGLFRRTQIAVCTGGGQDPEGLQA